MRLRDRWQVRFFFAPVFAVGGLLVRLALTHAIGPGFPTYISFYPAVMLAAIFGGFWPGCVATLISALMVDFWILPPSGIFIYQTPVDFIGQLIFVGMGVLMSGVSGRLRFIREHLEQLVSQRTAALKTEVEERKLAVQKALRSATELGEANDALHNSQLAALNLAEDAILARQEAEKTNAELIKLNRTLSALGKSSQEMVRAQNEADYLRKVCAIIVEDCGHTMVWIGYAENDEEKSVKPVASAGFEEGYLENLNFTWADTERGQGPTGTSIRTGKVCMCRNMLTDPQFAPWREQALSRGYASSIGLPLIAGGVPFGALNIYSRNPDSFSDDEVVLLADIANDLANGITGLWLREAQKTSEDQLSDRAKELAAANKELESFAYSVSHDLRAPLRAIYGFSEMLQDEYLERLDETGRDYLRRIRGGAERMNGLIDDIMSLSQVSRHEIILQDLDLSGMAAAILNELGKTQPRRRVVCSVAPALSGRADRRLIEIALTNLLQNAWKYTGKKEDARIEFGTEDRNGENAFYVRDNGAGFDMKHVDRLFTPFSRLHKEQDFPGTGIGLAIVNRVVARHGGRVWAEGAPGHGACFWFTLPARRDGARPSGAPKEAT
jgi:signal transduction histidine kinase